MKKMAKEIGSCGIALVAFGLYAGAIFSSVLLGACGFKKAASAVEKKANSWVE